MERCLRANGSVSAPDPSREQLQGSHLKVVPTLAAECLSALGLHWGGGGSLKMLALAISLLRHVLNGCEVAHPSMTCLSLILQSALLSGKVYRTTLYGS